MCLKLSNGIFNLESSRISLTRKERPMKVLHVLNELRPSGMEKMLESSGAFWSYYGVTGVIIGNGPSHPFRPNLEKAGYEVITISSIKSFRGLLQYWKTVRTLDVDVIHNHSESMHGFIAILNRAAFPNKILIRTVHNCFTFNGVDYLKRKIQDRLEKISLVKRISPSKDVHDHELVFWRNRSVIIENWVDVASIYQEMNEGGESDPSDNLKIILVGNCSPVKNHELLFSLINQSYKVEIIHIGDPKDISNCEKELLREVVKLGIEVTDIQTSNPYPYFNDADIHVVPSLHEGFGLVIAESALFGLPTIVNNIQGVQWARDLESLHFFSSEDELRQKILFFIGEKIEGRLPRKQSGSPLLRTRLSPERGVQEYAEFYKRHLDRN